VSVRALGRSSGCPRPDPAGVGHRRSGVHPRLITAILVLLGTMMSGVIHEMGHAIVGRMAGLHVIYIQLFPPGLRLSGEATRFWNAAISISGMLFAVLVGLAGVIGVVLLETKWPSIRYAVWLFVPMLAQSLGWFCVSLVNVLGFKVPNDDVQKFTQQTQLPPLLVSLIGLVLAVFCVVVLKWVWK
jgi:hypothetical protein